MGMIPGNPESKPWFLIEIGGPENIRHLSTIRPIKFEAQAFDQAGADFTAKTAMERLAETRMIPVYMMTASAQLLS